MDNIQKEISWVIKEKYNCKPSKNLNKDIARLKNGEPVDYVIGFVDFLNCRIDLSKKPLIPRTETEFWVKEAIKEIEKKGNVKILDIFSGSGCVGLAVLKNAKNVKVDFAEKDGAFVNQIRINIRLNKINKKRAKVIKSDIFSAIKDRYNYILANPPYISKKRVSKIQKSVLKFEPKNALFGGVDGFFYINKFLKEASNFLKEKGRIYMEFDYIQKKGIDKLLKKYGYKKYHFSKDQFGKPRFLVVEK